MSKIYTIAFRMGVLFNVLLWTILNILSFFEAHERYLSWSSGTGASDLGGFVWGFPFKMFLGHGLFALLDLVLNTIVYVASGFFFGFLFKFVWSKSSRRDELI